MSKHTLTTVVEGDLLSVTLFYEGHKVSISNSGGVFQSTNTIEVTGPLNVTMIVSGIAPATWKLTITEGSDKLVDEHGTIGPGNIDTFSTAVILPDVGPEALPADSKPSKKPSKKSGKKSGKKGGS